MLGYIAAVALLPLIVAVVVFAVAINIFQVGFIFTGSTLTFDLTRINPISGFQRIFSMRGLVRLVMGICKVIIVATVLYWTIWGERNAILALGEMEFKEMPGSEYLKMVEPDRKQYAAYYRTLEKSWELERKWDEEDQRNLHRLVDIRAALWT